MATLTDLERDLTERAARAAGLSPIHWSHHLNAWLLAPGCTLWNPRTDDGDSRRLVVALEMETGYTNGTAWARVRHNLPVTVPGGSDPCDALRQAVLLAAVEAGIRREHDESTGRTSGGQPLQEDGDLPAVASPGGVDDPGRTEGSHEEGGDRLSRPGGGQGRQGGHQEGHAHHPDLPGTDAGSGCDSGGCGGD